MISQHQFNNVLKELNVSFAALAERIEKLEKKGEVKDGDTKKGKSKG
jgi:DNA-binding Lrp family transcriptional regulator